MVARGKVITAKWGVPATEPDDLPDFMSNEEIVEKMGGEPKGVFRVLIKKITVVTNKSDDQMLKIVAEINETDKAKKGYNGYVFFENQNINEKSAPFLKQFLRSFGVSWEDFQKRTKLTPETTVEPSQVISFGSVKIDSGKVFARITTRWQPEQNGYAAKTVVGRWLPQADDAADEELAEEEDDEFADDEELEDEESEDEAEDEGEDEEDEEAELREELAGIKSLVALKKRAKANDADADLTGLKRDGLIDLIVEQELLLDDEEEPEDEDEEEESDEDAEGELREELDGLTLAQLKKRAKDGGAKVATLRPIKDKEEVIDIIVEQELGEGEEDDNEPPF